MSAHLAHAPAAVGSGPSADPGCVPSAAALPPAEHPAAEEAEQRGQHRDRREHGEDHGERAGDRQPVEEAEVEHQDAEQRDAHRAAREQDGAPGGVERRDRRLFWRQSRFQAAPVPGDDEQRIVDADAKPDERGDDRRDGHDAHAVRQRGDRHQPAGHAGERGDERQQRGEQRAKRDEQHDRGGEHADHRAEGQRRLLLDGLAAKLDVESRFAGRLRRVDHPDDVRLGQVAGLLGEVDDGVGGAVVPADLRGPARTIGADHRRDLGERRDPGQRRAHPRR